MITPIRAGRDLPVFFKDDSKIGFYARGCSRAGLYRTILSGMFGVEIAGSDDMKAEAEQIEKQLLGPRPPAARRATTRPTAALSTFAMRSPRSVPASPGKIPRLCRGRAGNP